MATKFEQSADTRLLVAFLSNCRKGDTVTNDQLRGVVSRSIMPGDSKLQSARRIVQREYGLVFDGDGEHGLHCLTDSETVGDQDKQRRRMHNVAAKAVKRLATVDTRQLADQERKDYFASLSFHGTIKVATEAKKYQRIQQAVNGSELPFAKTLQLLTG